MNYILKAGVVFAATVSALCAAAGPTANSFCDRSAHRRSGRRLGLGGRRCRPPIVFTSARGYGVMAVDLASGKVTDKVVDGAGVHGVLPIPGSALVASANGRSERRRSVRRRQREGGSDHRHRRLARRSCWSSPSPAFVVIFNGKSKDATVVRHRRQGGRGRRRPGRQAGGRRRGRKRPHLRQSRRQSRNRDRRRCRAQNDGRLCIARAARGRRASRATRRSAC